ncbi:helix-turn-helix domain-containing protein [Candidatus Micrarchaeota archaeon]|nr:helix-turn-helix domain-containing protein [Candidatus Micrarchaeota archaeon]
MWVGEFKVWHEGSAFLDLTRKTGAIIHSYYLNSFEENGKEYILKVCIVSGKGKEEFLKKVHTEKRAQIFKVENNQIYFKTLANKAFHHIALEKSAFFIKPIVIKNGWQYWALAAIDKHHLTDMFNRIKKLKMDAKIELLSLKQKPFNFFLPAIFTNLTQLQTNAIKSAYRLGYYSYPRKISVDQLAKKLNIPRSTLQEHLRKAESKLLNTIFSETNSGI